MLTKTYEDMHPYDLPQTGGQVQEPEPYKFLRSTVFAFAVAATCATYPLVSLPTYQLSFIECAGQSNAHCANDVMPFRNFIVDDLSIDAIGEYLLAKPMAATFIAKLGPIVDRVYQRMASMKLNIVDDPDVDSSLLEVVILSGLPINEEFDEKDRLLFAEIDKAGLSEGLSHVVLLQG